MNIGMECKLTELLSALVELLCEGGRNKTQPLLMGRK